MRLRIGDIVRYKWQERPYGVIVEVLYDRSSQDSVKVQWFVTGNKVSWTLVDRIDKIS
jgi:hypothetical protein